MTRKLFSTIAAALLLPALAACSSVPEGPPLSRDPGPPPAFLKPVDVPPPAANEDSYLVGKRERQARKLANCIIAAELEDRLRLRAEMLAGREVDPADAKPFCPPEKEKKP